MKNFLLKNVNVVDVKTGKIKENAFVYVEGSKIKSFENVMGVKTFDCKGKYLVPGLINMHVHLFGSGKPSNTVNAKGDSQAKTIKFVKTPLGRIVLHLLYGGCLKQTINSGTTTVRAVGDIEWEDVWQRDKINAGKKFGPRILASGYAVCTPGGHADGAISMHGVTKEELEKIVELNAEHNVDWIKLMVTGGVMDAKERGNTGLKMSKEQIKWVCDKAHAMGYRVAAHCESTEGVEACVYGGVDTVEHSGALTDALVAEMKKKGTVTTCTISPAYPYAKFDPEMTHCTEAQTYTAQVVAEGVVESAKRALKENMPIGLGTDASCPYAFHYAMWRELYYFTKLVGGDNKLALKMATIGNAEILGLDKEIGSIEAGKEADMFLVDENPFDNVRTLSEPKMVVKGGKMLKNPKVKRYADFEKLLDDLLK